MIEEVMSIIDSDSRPYWEGTREKKLVIQHCPACGQYQFYPRVVCKHCMSDVDWIEAIGEGTVYSYTIVHRVFNPYFKEKVPFVVALVELKEGPRIMSNIVNVNIDDVRIGMEVKAIFKEDFGEYKLVQFIPIKFE
ncbi:Zn-ribbon domain-containing OB-fold protein [Bacillus sp. JJ1562]|uniref:Zn-ribbon domain-containing OB-fold protein n=1 Tax=Bacillus sp. JJ1562 TaxID=3122960 RepID=UPI0030012951